MGGEMKGCELCCSPARMFCDSDQASLCWDCDAKVHGANFLVARHTRTLLCHSCQAPTPWKASGAKLVPTTVSICYRCVAGRCGAARATKNELQEELLGEDEEKFRRSGNEGLEIGYENEVVDENEEEEDGDEDSDDNDEDDDSSDENGEEEETENQVVPWSSTAPPPLPSSSSSSDGSFHGPWNRDGGVDLQRYPLKRPREALNFRFQGDLECCLVERDGGDDSPASVDSTLSRPLKERRAESEAPSGSGHGPTSLALFPLDNDV